MANFNRFSGFESLQHLKGGGEAMVKFKGASMYHKTGSKPVLEHEPTARSIEEENDWYMFKSKGSDFFHTTTIARDIANVKKRRG